MPVLFSKDQWAGHQGQGSLDESGGGGGKTRFGRGGAPQLPVRGVQDRVGVGKALGDLVSKVVLGVG